MKEQTKARLWFFALALILLGAFLLRIQQWGNFTITDEQSQALWTWDIFTDPFPVNAYPPLILYFNYYLAVLLKALLSFLGFLPFGGEFVNSGLGLALHLKASQLLMALFGTVHVYLVYRIGREFYNRNAAFLAAVLMAVNPFMILNNHTAKNDTFLALFLTLALYFVFRYARQPRQLPMFLASFCFGLAVAAKYNAALAAVFIAAALFWAAWPLRRGWRLLLAGAGTAVAGTLAGFFLGAPNWLVHPVANAKAALADVTFLYSGFSLYDKPTPSFHLYFRDFIYNFGWTFTLLFIVGLLAVLVSKRRTDTLLAVFILAYIGFFGRSAFYGFGTPLPIYPAMVLLMAKALFVDLPPLLSRWPRLRRSALAILWLPIAAFAVSQGARSIELFHILESSDQVELAYYYRNRHIPKGYRFASEMYTRHQRGDIAGNPDLTHIRMRYFKKTRPILFIASSFRSEYILTQTKNMGVKRELLERLRGYTPFHKIRKTSYPPGDYDVQFWYKTPRCLHRVPAPPAATPPGLPRQFIAASGPLKTILLPLQTYEKNPLCGRTENGSFSRWLYSTREISSLRFRLFAIQDNIAATIRVNGLAREIFIPKAFEIIELEMPGLAPRKLHADFVYGLEVLTVKKGAACHLAVFPQYATPGHEPPSATLVEAREPIPELFAADYPSWLVKFYRQTGIDLSLLQFVNRETLFRNELHSCADAASDFLPIDKGGYWIEVRGTALLKDLPAGKGMQLKLAFVSAQGLREVTIPLAAPDASGSIRVPFFSAGFVFLSVGITGTRENNFLLQDIVMLPDYREYCQTGGH